MWKGDMKAAGAWNGCNNCTQVDYLPHNLNTLGGLWSPVSRLEPVALTGRLLQMPKRKSLSRLAAELGTLQLLQRVLLYSGR